MSLTAADRAFLSQSYRYVELSTPAIQTAHPGAREADRGSPFLLAAAATAVLTAIDAVLSADSRLAVVTLEGIVTVNLAGSTPNVTLYADRFGLTAGRQMLIQGITHKWSAPKRTILYLWG